MKLLRCFLLVLCVIHAKSQRQYVSPCPRLFVYEGKSKEPDRWYGIVTLMNDSLLKGISLRLIFDRPTIQLGNWFGQISTNDNKEYLIETCNFELKPHTPHPLRFFVKFDPTKPPPRLVSFQQNGKTVCPEGGVTEAPGIIELQTSGKDNTDLLLPNPETAVRPSVISLGGVNSRPQAGSTDEEDFDPPGFHNLFNQPTATESNLNAICGTVTVQPRAHTNQGQSTYEGEFPWHAALFYGEGIDLSYICGATLISKYHVISVAHCVTRKKSQTSLNPNNLVVYLGKYYLKRFSTLGIQDRQVERITTHPQYNPQSYTNNLAIIKLLQAAEFTDYVRPVCLWQDSSDLSTILNKAGVVAGWGFDETGRVTEQLVQAKMPVVSHETCVASSPNFYSKYTSTSTYCASFKNGTTVCNGDSGDGMVFSKSRPNARTPIWQLRGLVSISVALRNKSKCDASHYVVFTDTVKYLDWIKRAIAS